MSVPPASAHVPLSGRLSFGERGAAGVHDAHWTKMKVTGWEQLLLAEPIVGLDQTSWPRLDGKADKPWQIWCLTMTSVHWVATHNEGTARLRRMAVTAVHA